MSKTNKKSSKVDPYGKEELERIKSNVKDFYDYFQPNYERFNFWRNFVFKSSLSPSDISLNQELDRPNIEFNIMESKLNRILGEFAKSEPSLSVHGSDSSLKKPDPMQIMVVEGHIRTIFFESNRDNMEYEIYRDCITGGFSAFKIYTDYLHPMSLDQQILMKRCFDPTLVGFDKMASESHKGDGKYCYELFPWSKEKFEEKYGSELTKNMRFKSKMQTGNTNQFGDFNWSYTTGKEQVVLICDYYEKKFIKTKIVQLRDGTGQNGQGMVMTESDYKKMVQNWNFLSPIPAIVKTRETETVQICRTTLVENDILNYEETDYSYLPLIFVDGNSIFLRENSNGTAQQMCRPMMYHMLGVQKLKNFAGIMLANHIENTPQSQFIVAVESIPAEYKDMWLNPQRAGLLAYNPTKDNDPTQPLPPPSPVPRPIIPQEIMQTFMSMDQVSQEILGSYDSALGINNNELSGSAIKAGATQSNAASMPYMVNYIRSLNQSAEIILDLIPKYIDTARALPVKNIAGKEFNVPVNIEGGVSMQYDPNSLGVKVEAGVNFELQRQQAFDVFSNLMDRLPPIQQLIGTTPEGMEMLLENIDVRGIDALKAILPKFMKQQAQQQQQQQQMQQQMQQAQIQQMQQPMMIEAQSLKQRADADTMEAQIKAAELQIKQQDSETKRLAVVSKVADNSDKIQLAGKKLNAENTRSLIDSLSNRIDQTHQKDMDMLKLHHEVNKSENENITSEENQ